MTDEPTIATVPNTVRDGKQVIVHYFTYGQPIGDNSGIKRGIEQDLDDNYRVKIHAHGHVNPDKYNECDCQILGTVERTSEKETRSTGI